MRHTWAALPLLLAACSSPSAEAPPSPDWDAQIREVNQALVNRGELDRIPEFIAESYVMHTPNGPQTGRHLVRGFISDLLVAFPDLEVETEVMAVDGDRVVWKRTHRGTHQGPFMGVEPSGRTVSWEAIVVSRYEDGMVMEEWGASTLGAALLTP